MTDERLDAWLRAALRERADDVAARSVTPEQMASRMASRVPPGTRLGARTAVSRLAWVIALALLVLATVRGLAGTVAPAPTPLKLAVDLSMTAEPGTDAIAKAIQLGVLELAGGSGRYRLSLPDDAIFDDSPNGVADAREAAGIANRVVADPSFVALVGPYLSSLAQVQIPVTNAAGLTQCAPSNTEVGLTTGEASVALRPLPDRANYVRVVATDEALARAAATFVVDRLGRRSVYVIRSGREYAGDPADAFRNALSARGGAVVGETSMPDLGGPLAALTQDVGRARADAIWYDGGGGAGAAALVRALDSAGLGGLPVIGIDPLLDGPADVAGSFLHEAGALAERAYGLFPAVFDSATELAFESRYRARFGTDPAPYAVAGYACVQVIVDALGRVPLAPDASAASWREAIRAAVTDPAASYQTVIGTIGFDRNGDVSPVRVGVYRGDPRIGRWSLVEAIPVSPTP